MSSVQLPVTVSLKDLRTESIKLSTLSDAFGPSSLGIIIVKDLPPTFQPLRMRLLKFASRLAQLPESELDLLTNPSAHYNVGWSHGKEALKSGQYDTLKGSFYATVLSSHLQMQYRQVPLGAEPNFEHANMWPPEDLLPNFRATFEELCTLIMDIALLVARACDQYVAYVVESYEAGMLERVVRDSLTNRARLLHYFPPAGVQSSASPASDDQLEDSWCASHVDDGCLTGLTSALYVDESSSSMSAFEDPPDPQAGLFIRSRASEVVKVSIPADCLAFQTGTALELMTGGVLKAVPHFVRGPSSGDEGGKGVKLARNTLVVFTQPDLDEIVDAKTRLTFREHIRLADEEHT